MIISTKGRYATRMLLDIAQHQEQGYVSMKSIAARQGISKKYLESIVKLLVTGKLVKGTSGKGGGYSLTKLPEEYHILDILELTEGSLSSVACLENGAEKCPFEAKCKTVSMWKGYNNLTRDYFSRITIKDLL